MNPLDWPAEPFLTFYVAVAAAALGVAIWMRMHIGPRPASVAALDPVELATLREGPGRATDTVLVALFGAGGAGMEEKSGDVWVDAQRAVLPPWMERFRAAASGTMTRAAFHVATRPAIDDVVARLQARGLVPTGAQVAPYRWQAGLVLAVPLLLGGAKVMVGLSRGRPVGILLVLLLVTAGVALVLLTKRPLRTQAGRAAAEAAQAEHARAMRAPLPEELAWAFAAGGAAVLVGTPYAAYAQQIRSSSGDGGGSSDSSGGDGGGGGCGGCSG